MIRVILQTGLKRYRGRKIHYTEPVTYRLKDLNGEEKKGSFYEPELQKAQQEILRIDKVIRRDYKGRKALVKWKRYSDDFNSWIPFKDITSARASPHT